MAFKKETKTTDSKNQFTAMLHSVKTDKGITFINLTPEFVKSVFGVRTLEEVTAEQAENTLPGLMDNEKVYVKIYDLTAERPIVDASEY